MKTWRKYSAAEDIDRAAIIPVPTMPECSPMPIFPETANIFECAYCSQKAQIFFEGTSYCRPCLSEKQRVGTV